MACTRVFLAIDADAHVIDQSKRHPAVQPCLRPIPAAALLRAKEEQSLHSRNLTVAVLYVLEEVSDGVLGEDGAVVKGGEAVFHAGFAAAPTDRVGEYGIQQSLGEIGASGFHVTCMLVLGDARAALVIRTSEGGSVDKVEQRLHPAEVRV